MSSSNRQASLSPGERKRTKSQSSSRSQRTPSNINVHEEDTQQEKTSTQTTKRISRETNSAHNQSINVTSPRSKKQRSKGKTSKSKSPPSHHKGRSKRKKTSINISDLDSKQVSQPNDCHRQDLSARGLSFVPPEIFELVTLRRLVLSNNNLPGLPSNIRSLVNLEYLDISRNPLRIKNGVDDYSCLPRDFRYLQKLETLIMAECTLKYIPAAVWNILSLETLDISRNKVGYIVVEIGNLTNIRHIRLSQMDLDTLPPEIGFCDKLQTIDLTGNPIDNLPETLVECRQLYELKINYKTFYKLLDNYMLQLIDEGKIRSEHIPHVVYELENLEILDLNQTKLNFIPNQHSLRNLNELYLSNNSFFNIPESICTMEQLKIFDISHNRLQNIPDYFIQIKRLETFILSYNNLTILPNNISRISTLIKLVVSHNQINTIENGFSQTRSLLTLDLSYNNLKIISEDLCNLEQLETLDLRYNQIEYLPISIRQMIGLKSMNIFDEDFQRFGLHLLGNSLIDPPSYIWKSTSIQTLFDYIETKDKLLSNHFIHLKLILIGPKNIGKTTLITKLLNNQKIISNTQKTLDMYVSILQENRLKLDEQNAQEGYNQLRPSNLTSSILTDQWIEERISTTGENFLSRLSTCKRIYPPPLKTYRSNELFEYFINKSTLITKNNIFYTIFDITSEPNFEILYPLIYDSNALFILPVNLTILLNIIQAAANLENMHKNENEISIIDYDALLTNDWLYYHIFRYIQSISDYCQQASIAIVGFIFNCQIGLYDQQRQLLDEINSKVNRCLNNKEYQRKNIKLYSEFFSEPIHLDDDEMIDEVVEKLENIAQQWNIKHHKQKRQIIKRRLGFIEQDSILIDYETCLKHFEQLNPSFDHDDKDEENKKLLENEINQMNFDECLDYLKLTGDILCFGQNTLKIILLKPYYLLNNILSRTIFRPYIDQWLNYDDNMIFRFSGYYRTQELFDIDRQRLLIRGEYTWKMLNLLFSEQNNDEENLIKQNIIDYCHLMEYLYLGYLNESNINYQEFTTFYFVCPWLLNEKCLDINYFDYFKLLEQKRSYENLQLERTRKIKQRQLWFVMDNDQENIPKHFLETNLMEDLPSIDQIEIFNSQIIKQDSIKILKILNENSNFLPDGLYERLLICLHPLFYERLDYSNITLGRTIEKNLIQIERFDNENYISITINNYLLEHIQNLLIHNLFSFYPSINFRIET